MSGDPRPGAGEVAAALVAVSAAPVPELRSCLDLARAYERAGEPGRAVRWAHAAIDAGEDLAGWLGAAGIVRRCRPQLPPPSRRVRVAVLGSYTTGQFCELLQVAADRAGAEIELYECGFAQYRIELLDPGSGLHAFAPEVVVLAVHEGEVTLPRHSDDPERAVEQELRRWTSLWDQVAQSLGARVVQHNFAIPPEVPLGHLASRVPGSRYAMLQRLNQRLGEAAGEAVGIVDCERLAGMAGKHVWFDPRYQHLAKQAVGLGAIALLARHTAAVLGAQLGLSRKCLVLDLDNTVWGGVLGEVGPHGIAVGAGPVGEAYSAFQRHVLALKDAGVVLAVCSKNEEADVREVFSVNPDMLLTLDDVAVLVASWDDKPGAVRQIAARLGLGLDALVFVDDNPAEREAVRQLVPEVDVVPLPADPAGYVRALAAYPFFESAALTAEDAARTEQYRMRANVAALQGEAGSLEDFLRSLGMEARFDRLGEHNLTRVTQLVGKTNQFNLTTRRRGRAELEAIATDGCWVTQVVRLVDRFADHGIIGVLLAEQRGDVVEIDTWLLSCRVIGRTVEEEMMSALAEEATSRGCRAVTGRYVPSPKNGLVAELYPRLGFRPTGEDPETGATRWSLALPADDLARSLVTRTVHGPAAQVVP